MCFAVQWLLCVKSLLHLMCPSCLLAAQVKGEQHFSKIKMICLGAYHLSSKLCWVRAQGILGRWQISRMGLVTAFDGWTRYRTNLNISHFLSVCWRHSWSKSKKSFGRSHIEGVTCFTIGKLVRKSLRYDKKVDNTAGKCASYQNRLALPCFCCRLVSMCFEERRFQVTSLTSRKLSC